MKMKIFESDTSSAQRPASRFRVLRRKGNHRAGFTLIEILIAISILAVGILGISMLQTSSLSGETLTRDMDSAINLASDALDRIQANAENINDYVSGNFSGGFTVSDTSSPPSGATASVDHDALQAELRDMHLTNAILTVTFQVDTPITGADTATAIVSWDYKGSPKQCQIKTIIY